jgi:hypothetical protein
LRGKGVDDEIINAIADATGDTPEAIPIIIELMLNEVANRGSNADPYDILRGPGGLTKLLHQNIGSEKTPYLQIASQIIMFGEMSVDAAKYVLAPGTDSIDHPYLTVSGNTISLHPFIRETMNL